MKKKIHLFGNITSYLLLLLLILVLLVWFMPVRFSSADQDFTYINVQDARQKALECLMICGFSTEWNNKGEANVTTKLMRWNTPIKIFLTGSPSYDDKVQLNRFIMEIATHCPNIPNITLVDNEKKANITIYYGPLDTLSQHVDFYQEGNYGSFSYRSKNHVIVSGKIGIATDVNDDAAKSHLLREELVGLLGLTNDHEIYSDSILYQQWTTVDHLSDVDWLMLNMLYDQDLRCGMSASKAHQILRKKILR